MREAVNREENGTILMRHLARAYVGGGEDANARRVLRQAGFGEREVETELQIASADASPTHDCSRALLRDAALKMGR
jgi:hypothetical protein